MKHGDMLKLRWLKMIAINDLHSDEYDIIIGFTTRYMKGETPSFTDKEIATLCQIYERVRKHYLSLVAGANVPPTLS